MAPLIVLLTSFGLLLLLARLGVRSLASRMTCLRGALAVMFLVTASAHWGSRRADLVRMVPPGLANPELLVTVTGVAEIAGAVGLLFPRLAPYAAAGLAVLLVAVFPANVHAARAGVTIAGSPPTPLAVRAALQILFLAAVVAAGFGARKERRGSRRGRPTTCGSSERNVVTGGVALKRGTSRSDLDGGLG